VTSSRFIRFLLVGGVNTIVGYGSILLLQYVAGLSPVVANAGGYLVGMVLSYFLNRSFTFSSSRPHLQTVPVFTATVAACFALNLAVLKLCLGVDMPPLLAQAIAVGSYSMAFYFASKLLVFTNKRA
jgi:putative flippase GtrA